MKDEATNWTEIRKPLVQVALGRFPVTEVMSVAELEVALQPFKGEASVEDALRALESQKTLAADLARRQVHSGSLYTRMKSHAIQLYSSVQRWLLVPRQRA